MDAFPQVACPYCHAKSRWQVDCRFFTQAKVIRCESEDGGCDKDFVLDFWATFDHKTRKIED